MSDRKFEHVIVYSAKGACPPEAFFKKLEAEGYTSCASMAAAVNGKIAFQIVPETVSVEELVTLAEDGKDEEVFYHFGKFPEDFDKDDDPQPHIVLRNNDAVPVVIAFLRGDFSEWADPKDEKKRSPEFFAVQTKLVEMLGKLYSRNEENVDQLFDDILTKKTSSMLSSLYGNEGDIILLSNTGKHLMISDKREQNRQEWGWITANFPYKEVETPEKQEAPKSRFNFKKRDGSVPTVEPPKELKEEFAAKIADSPPTPEEIAETAPTTDTKIPTKPTVIKIAIPPKYSQQQRKKFIQNKRKHHGVPNWKDLPKGWTTADYIEVPDNKSLEGIKTLQAQATNEEVVADDLPEQQAVMSADTVQTLVQDFLPGVKDATIGFDQKAVFDPAALRGLESELPKFVESIGLKDVRETLNWPFEALLYIAEIDPKAIALDSFDCRSEIIRLIKENAALKAKLGEEKGQYQTEKPRSKFTMKKVA